MSVALDIIQRDKDLRQGRGVWDNHWQELAEVFLPRRADFTRARSEGESRLDNIFDSTPMQARRGLASSIDGLLKPKNGKWFHITVRDEDLKEDDEVKLWLDDATEQLAREMYFPGARFIQRSGEVDDDLVTFGTGILFIGESKDLGRLMFRSISLKNGAIGEDSDGKIDTLYITMPLTARQAEQRYGDKIGDKTKEALKKPNAKPDERFDFIQAIQPRKDRDPRKRDNLNMPFADTVVDVKSEHIVREAGFQEFPAAVPRWDTASDELYGRSPAMIALGDALTLQAQAETLLRAGQKEVDPPLLVADDSIFEAPRTYPGGIIPYDLEMAVELGRVPVEALRIGSKIPLGREMQNDSRDLVQRAFFRNVFNLPIEGPQMTATEILERKEEFIREIGPVFGRLGSDYVEAVVDRSFNIMLRGGGFTEPPEILKGREVEFELISPVERARKQIEAAGFARSLELIAPIAEVQPEVWDNINGDKVYRASPEIFGWPEDWLRPTDDVNEIREGRAEQQQAETQALQAQQIADIAKTGSEVVGATQE